MNHDVFFPFKHIFVWKDEVFVDLAVIFRDVVDELLWGFMLQVVRHFICINPIFSKLLMLFFVLLVRMLWPHLFKNYIVLNDLLVFEQNTLNFMQRLFVNLKVFRYDGSFLGQVNVFLNNKFHRLFTFFVLSLFIFLIFDVSSLFPGLAEFLLF